MKTNKFPMERIALHPDDIKKNRKKHVRTKPYNKRKRPCNYKGDDPWIEDINIFKAVSFARQIMKDDNKSIELAMHIASKHYKVPLHQTAVAMGKLAASRKKRMFSKGLV